MKNKINHSSFLRSITLLVLIGHLSANTLSYCTFLLNSELEIIELFTSEDSESEEEDKKEDKKDRFQPDTATTEFDVISSSASVLHSENYLSLHHPEISTPPPEYFNA